MVRFLPSVSRSVGKSWTLHSSLTEYCRRVPSSLHLSSTEDRRGISGPCGLLVFWNRKVLCLLDAKFRNEPPNTPIHAPTVPRDCLGKETVASILPRLRLGPDGVRVDVRNSERQRDLWLRIQLTNDCKTTTEPQCPVKGGVFRLRLRLYLYGLSSNRPRASKLWTPFRPHRRPYPSPPPPDGTWVMVREPPGVRRDFGVLTLDVRPQREDRVFSVWKI